jgi:GNAT superfamily N-acetyltransferase
MWGVENRTAAVHVWVLPDARGRGIGTALIADLATYARNAGMEHWLSNALEDDERSLRFADRLGLQRGPAGQAGFLDLGSAGDPPVTLNDGTDDDVVLTTYADRTDLARAMYDLEVRVAPEIPALSEETPPTYEAWSAETAGDPGFVRDLSVLAVSGDRLVGAISIYDLGDRTAYIGMTAVHPETRRMGIARRMKEDLTRRARSAGWQRLMTYNDGDNEAIRVLNEHLGYVYLPRVIRLKGPIPPDEVGR